MLILTRRIGESIMIGDDVEIVVSSIRGRQTQISIDAPEQVKIYRKEIYNKIQHQLAAEKSDRAVGQD